MKSVDLLEGALEVLVLEVAVTDVLLVENTTVASPVLQHYVARHLGRAVEQIVLAAARLAQVGGLTMRLHR